MDVQLQQLIDKIKKDGVAAAEAKSDEIITEAEKKAEAIIQNAKEQAAEIIKNAKAEAERAEKSSEAAIGQAARNIIISCREHVNKEISAILQNQIEKNYNKDLLKNLIPDTVKAWAKNTEAEDVTVLLSQKDLDDLQDYLYSSLKEQVSKGLEIKGDNSITSGFRVGSKSEGSFYDFSSDELVALFANYLNPKTAEIMKAAAKDEQ